MLTPNPTSLLTKLCTILIILLICCLLIVTGLFFLGRKRKKLFQSNNNNSTENIIYKWAKEERSHHKYTLQETSMMSSVLLLFSIPILTLLVQKSSSAIPTCQTTCGTIPIRYPFGTGYGCGHPAFSKHIKCNLGTLEYYSTTRTTSNNAYTVSSIDYASSTVIITDPFMSNCTEMQNSGSFTLGDDTPFTLSKENIFVLLGCSTTSPMFDSREDFCDTGSGSRVCRGMYSCRGVTGIGLPQNAPISTCCVYDYLTGIGLGYSLDLPKLQCSSYASVYEFGDEGDPMKWKFGVSLDYNDSYNYSDACKDCEASGGFCGFANLDESFSCVCNNGVNTTTNCFGQGNALSGTMGLKIQTVLTTGGLVVSWMLLLLQCR